MLRDRLIESSQRAGSRLSPRALQAIGDLSPAPARPVFTGDGVVTRRGLFRAGATGLLGSMFAGSLLSRLIETPALAAPAVKTGQFVFPRLQFTVYDETTDMWNISPIGDVNLRKKLQSLTNINVSQDPKVVHLGDFDEMCRFPFVFMTSEGYFKLPEKEEKNLREFLERGGFVLADDCAFASREDRFFRCYIELLNKLFPDNPVRKIPLDHEIFHCYFDLPDGAPHCQGVPHGAHGLFEPGTGRLMSVITPGDIHCGWCNHWFTPQKNEQSIQMGINTIIYFLTH
jgi:hypothetical protein